MLQKIRFFPFWNIANTFLLCTMKRLQSAHMLDSALLDSEAESRISNRTNFPIHLSAKADLFVLRL